MRPRPTHVWYPAKVLPWSSITMERNGAEVEATGPDGCYGFTPMYETEEAARVEFPDDLILSFMLEPVMSTKKRKPAKKRKDRAGGGS